MPVAVSYDRRRSNNDNGHIAVVLSSNLNLVDAPGNVLLGTQNTRLPRDSVADVSQ